MESLKSNLAMQQWLYKVMEGMFFSANNIYGYLNTILDEILMDNNNLHKHGN